MAEYYVSSESFWEHERGKHEMVGRGIDVLSSLDSSLIMVFRELESDKYGLMSRSSYSSLSRSIEKCREKSDDLTNYARRIHGMLEEKEFDFFKGLNGVFEELSLLDIQDYTTENTLNITETVILPSTNTYTPGGIMYMNEEVKKGKINITDIQTKTDVLGMQKQFEAYMKENGKTNIDVNKLKEDFYKGVLTTQFEHEVYSSGFWKGLSSILDYVPLVGGVKNTIEACVGYSMTGEKLTTGERVLLGVLGVASAVIDVFAFGAGTGLIQGGKVVGKQVAKGMAKQVGKYAVMDITASVAIGWTSNYASEKLRDMGLSSEEIFMVHLVASLSVMGYSKYKTNKVNINGSDKKAAEIITDGSHLENGKLNDLGKIEGATEADFYVGPKGKTLSSQYKDWIGTNRGKELLNSADNSKLQNAIKQLYRGESIIGDGGTADVIRFERETLINLGKNGNTHMQKGADMQKYLQKIIDTENLSTSDFKLANELLNDLKNALGGN